MDLSTGKFTAPESGNYRDKSCHIIALSLLCCNIFYNCMLKVLRLITKQYENEQERKRQPTFFLGLCLVVWLWITVSMVHEKT